MESIENKGLFNELNTIITQLNRNDLMKYFKLDGYIRVNGYFISPFSLISIKRGLSEFLISWEMSEVGWIFTFKNKEYVHFKGLFSSQIKEGKIIYIKIDAGKPEYSSPVYYDIIVRYLKCLDTFYFMLTEVEEEFEILTNPLGSSRGWFPMARSSGK
ncbi:uncharacterized protein NEMAJ01_2232 [Nematocida major]|uniref:uncharacterized protein n=1 Tax=Nematocida major TaxID=1912982 RepID=UPI0020083E7B|nr:uncharacterized protein NEMAJ01_2232 [Nematocida major]KAH9387336.1 hypothetical protein NEMAJ01_2232 [Nematocida major]